MAPFSHLSPTLPHLSPILIPPFPNPPSFPTLFLPLPLSPPPPHFTLADLPSKRLCMNHNVKFLQCEMKSEKRNGIHIKGSSLSLFITKDLMPSRRTYFVHSYFAFRNKRKLFIENFNVCNSSDKPCHLKRQKPIF